MLPSSVPLLATAWAGVARAPAGGEPSTTTRAPAGRRGLPATRSAPAYMALHSVLPSLVSHSTLAPAFQPSFPFDLVLFAILGLHGGHAGGIHLRDGALHGGGGGEGGAQHEAGTH